MITLVAICSPLRAVHRRGAKDPEVIVVYADQVQFAVYGLESSGECLCMLLIIEPAFRTDALQPKLSAGAFCER
jgi:hypothetical protein